MAEWNRLLHYHFEMWFVNYVSFYDESGNGKINLYIRNKLQNLGEGFLKLI